MKNCSKKTINELKEINLVTTNDPKPTFVSAMLNDKEAEQYV